MTSTARPWRWRPARAVRERARAGTDRERTSLCYEAVVFDLFGTLIDNFSRRDYEGALADMADALAVGREDFARLWLRSAPDRGSGLLPTVESNVHHCLRAVGRAADEAAVAHAARIRMALTERALVPRRGAVEKLVALRSAGAKLGLISDCSSDGPRASPTSPLASLFDAALFSCDVGVRRPDPRIYRLACDRLGVPPERCLYVGDGGSRELTGAAAIGMHPVAPGRAKTPGTPTASTPTTPGREPQGLHQSRDC